MDAEQLFRSINPASCLIRVSKHSVRQFQLRFPTRPSPRTPYYKMLNILRKCIFSHMKNAELAVYGDGFWEFLVREVLGGNARGLYVITCWNNATDRRALRKDMRRVRDYKLRKKNEPVLEEHFG